MSVTQFHAGTANNVIPATAQLIISIRTFSAAVQELVGKRLGERGDGVGRMYGAGIELEYARGVPPTVNDTAEADFAADIGDEVVGADRVNRSPNQGMGSEDFSIMLARRPGAFVWLGGGAPGKDWGLHHPKYDFNDDALPVGASFFAQIGSAKLPRSEEHTSELQSLMHN